MADKDENTDKITLQSKVLFLTSSEYGQANVILAVAWELQQLQKYEIHIGSFSPLKNRIEEMNKSSSSSSSSNNSNTSTSPIIFHTITGPSAMEALTAKDYFIGPFPPGVKGAIQSYKITLPAMATTWEGPEYIAGYKSCIEILEDINANLIVIDPLISQGLEACKSLGLSYVVLSPNTFREILGKQQPFLAQLCRYPALCSAFPYPVPWHLIPSNIYLKLQLFIQLLNSNTLKTYMNYRKSQGLPKLPPVFSIYEKQYTYLVPSIPETDFPCRLEENVTPCGPILLPVTPVEEGDPELLAWLERGGLTVLINLGSHIRMDDDMIREFARGLKSLLDKRADVQILWKLKTSGGLGMRSFKKETTLNDGEVDSADPLKSIAEDMTKGRVRVEEWLAVDPLAILQSGHIACSVHHGGSNSFHEALSAGVPQVVLPCWMDTFDFANRVEYLGIGIYGSRTAAPRVEAKELATALLRVLGYGKESGEAEGMREKARELAKVTNGVGGRKKAVEKLVEILEG